MPNRYTYPDPDAVLEDLLFLDAHLVSAAEATRRIGFPTAEALEKWLVRRGRTELWKRLMYRDPSATHDSSTRARARRCSQREDTAA